MSSSIEPSLAADGLRERNAAANAASRQEDLNGTTMTDPEKEAKTFGRTPDGTSM